MKSKLKRTLIAFLGLEIIILIVTLVYISIPKTLNISSIPNAKTFCLIILFGSIISIYFGICLITWAVKGEPPVFARWMKKWIKKESIVQRLTRNDKNLKRKRTYVIIYWSCFAIIIGFTFFSNSTLLTLIGGLIMLLIMTGSFFVLYREDLKKR